MRFPVDIMSLFRRGSRSAVHLGLDLGNARMKLAAVSRDSEGELVVEMVEDVPAAAGGFINDQVADAGALSKQFSELTTGLKVAGKRIAMAAPAVEVMRRIDMPWQPRDRALKAIRANPMLQLQGLDAMNLAVDYYDLGGSAAGDGAGRRMDAFVMVARKDLVRSVQDVAVGAGYLPGLVSAPAVAIRNLFVHCMPDRAQEGKRVVLAHGGQSGVLFVLLDGGVPVRSYSAMVGMDYLASRAKGAEDEAYIGVAGMPPVGKGVLTEWYERLAQELKRTLGVTARDVGAGGVEVWISGGFSRVPDIAASLSESLGLAVNVFDPLSHLRMSEEMASEQVYGPAITVALGLAVEAAVLADKGER